jgi:hypothetical protein
MDMMLPAQPNIGSAFHIGVANFCLGIVFDPYEQDDLRCPGVRLKRDLLTLFLRAAAFAYWKKFVGCEIAYYGVLLAQMRLFPN